MKAIYIPITFALSLTLNDISLAQVYSDKIVGKKNTALADSIKTKPYPYVLPIWGAKAAKLGFDLPYSAGMSVQYVWQESDLIIDNLQVGFNNGPKTNLDQVIRFNNARSTATGVNFRPDIWLFPFLNVYGLFAKAQPSTAVDYGIWVPDGSGTWKEVVALNSKANFDATTVGFGLTPTIGVGGGWLALDMNFAWSSIAALKDPAYTFIFGPRMGKTFRFHKHPERNIAFWAGGFRLKLNSGTEGSLNVSDVLPIDQLQAQLAQGYQRVGDAQASVDSWWAGLTPQQQANPVNKARYETANQALAKAGSFLNSASAAVDKASQGTVQYSLDKRPKDMWNFVVGTQFQYNKHVMLRVEYGFMGSRTQLITGLQYRFGL